MHRLILVFLLSVLPCAGAMLVNPYRFVAGPSYIISQDFEGTGTPSGWTNITGTPDYDYATSPAPLSGAQSARFSASTAYGGYTATLASGWAYLIWSADSLSGNVRVLSLSDTGADTTGRFTLQANGSGDLVFYNGGSSFAATGAGEIVAGTVYHIWLEWTTGSGSNGVYRLWKSTTATRPGSPVLEVTNSTITTAGAMLLFRPINNNTIVDKLRVDDVEIGSDPQ